MRPSRQRRHDFIRLVRLLFPRRRGLALVAAVLDLTAYLDGSAPGPLNRPEQRRVMAYGGFLSPAKKWDAFNRDWKPSLGREGIAFFRSSPFYARTDLFQGWDDDRQARLMSELLQAIEKHAILAFGGILYLDAHESLIGPRERFLGLALSPQEHVFLDPHLFCLDMCVQIVMGLMLWSGLSPDQEKVAFVVEEDAKIRMENSDLAFHTFRLRNPGYAWLGKMVSGTKKEDLPLHAADLLAHQLFQNTAERREERGEIGNVLGWIFQTVPHIVWEYDAPQLAALPELQTLLARRDARDQKA